MRTTTKEIKKESEVKKETLKESFVLWIHTSKSGKAYLSGNLSDELGKGKLVGYFNSEKKNPKEPDIRVYLLNDEGKQDKEIAGLWEQISKSEKRYLTGLSDEKEKLVGFYDNEKSEKNTPYIKVYFEK